MDANSGTEVPVLVGVKVRYRLRRSSQLVRIIFGGLLAINGLSQPLVVGSVPGVPGMFEIITMLLPGVPVGLMGVYFACGAWMSTTADGEGLSVGSSCAGAALGAGPSSTRSIRRPSGGATGRYRCSTSRS